MFESGLKSFLRYMNIFILVVASVILDGCTQEEYTSTEIPSLTNWRSTIYAGTEFGGLYYSDDDGVKWKKAGLDNKSVHELVSSDSAIYAVVSEKPYPGFEFLYRSKNGGKSWEKVGRFTFSFVHTFNSSGSNLYVVDRDYIHCSKDGGKSWHKIGPEEDEWITDWRVYAFTVTGSQMYVSTTGGLFRSDDEGISWMRLAIDFSDAQARSLIVHGQRIYAGMGAVIDEWDKRSRDYQGPGVLYSEDGGDSWIHLGLDGEFVEYLAILGSTLYALCSGPDSYDYRIFCLRDISSSWEEVSTGFLAEASDNLSGVISFISSGQMLYAGTTDGLYRLKDGENVWHRVFFKEFKKDFYFFGIGN